MDKIIERLVRLEAQWMVLKDENCANKVTIKILESKLFEYEQKIKELTDEREAASSENSDVAKNEKRFRNLEKQIVKFHKQQQQEIQSVNKKFHKVDKLQHLLNCVILKKGTVNEKIERVSSRSDSISDAVEDLKSHRKKTEETQQAQAVPAASPMESQDEDSQIERKFKLCMTRVRDHNIPLTEDDYSPLAAVESIAGIPNGPAFQIVTNSYNGNSQEAESNRQVGIKKFHMKGINTKIMAMREYLKLCDPYTTPCHLPDTQYHAVRFGGHVRRILAIDSRGLRILYHETRKKFGSIGWYQVIHCELTEYGHVDLTLTFGPGEWFVTYEKINPKVYATICSFMGK